jgi:hypothetical protein
VNEAPIFSKRLIKGIMILTAQAEYQIVVIFIRNSGLIPRRTSGPSPGVKIAVNDNIFNALGKEQSGYW